MTNPTNNTNPTADALGGWESDAAKDLREAAADWREVADAADVLLIGSLRRFADAAEDLAPKGFNPSGPAADLMYETADAAAVLRAALCKLYAAANAADDLAQALNR